jgi:ABC-type antimicrobial peptide transport system permease subunit
MSTSIQPIPWSYPDDPLEEAIAEERVLTPEEERRYSRTQLQLIWLRFTHNRAAMAGGTVVLIMYLTALFGGFVAPYDADQRFDSAINAPPQMVYLVDNGSVYPHVLGLKSVVDR